MRINHNLIAINTHRQMSISENDGSKSMEKLSSGYRINRAGDDAAGLAISEKMRGQVRGLGMASRNSQDTISLLQTAEGALAETHDILQRMRELSVQSANDTNTDADRSELQAEVTQLRYEIDRIANTTEFNTKKLLEGSAKGVAEEVAGTARLNNNSRITIDSTKMNAMMSSVSNDKSWAFDGAYMLIKTNQSFNSGEDIYNPNDFKLVGPDGTIYNFRAMSQDTKVKASELEAGTILADGGAITLIEIAGDDLTKIFPSTVTEVVLGEKITDHELLSVSGGSILASGSTFTLVNSDGTGNIPGTTPPPLMFDTTTGTGVESIEYDSEGVLKLHFNSGTPTPIKLEVGKSIRLDNGTVLKNNGGGNVSVENGSLKLDGSQVLDSSIVSAFTLSSQSTLPIDADTLTKINNVQIVESSNYLVAAGEFNNNITLGNSTPLTGYDGKDGEIITLADGSVLAKGSTIQMINDGTSATAIKVMVNGNELTISYDSANSILKVGSEIVAPGRSVTLDDGTVLVHASELATPNDATGKIFIDIGRLTLAEDISANKGNVEAFSLAKDSTMAVKTKINDDTRLRAGTVITTPDKFYPGSVTLAHEGRSIQFSANANASLAARYYDTVVSESLTFIFSRYEPASSNLKDSVMAQIGANSGQTAFISMSDMRATALNVANVDISTKWGAATAIETVNNALQRVSHQRALLGAMQNRLEHSIKNLDTSAENLQAAESRIRDVDMAKEIMEYTKDSILMQSSQAMLAQANQIPQNVLQLLR